MRRIGALILIAMFLAAFVLPTPAYACLECVALGLASFAVFNQLFGPLFYPRVAPVYYLPYGAPYYAPPTVYHGSYVTSYYPAAYYHAPYSAPVYYPPRAYAYVAPSPPTVVQYPHGRYELRGDGLSVPYRWVWIPGAPAPSGVPAPAMSATPVSMPQSDGR
jgi:hypothetical protein